MTVLVEASGIGRRIGTGTDSFVLHVDHLRLEKSECVAITGPSGCGKSTLLGLLSLALRPSEAAIGSGCVLRLDGADVLAMWRRGQTQALAGLRASLLGYVPQTSALLSFLSLRDNIALPQAISGRRDPAYLEAIAEWLGILPLLDRRPAEVSVGQRQRAAIARAIAHRPAIVLADEPTASLHPSQAAEIMGMLHALSHHTGVALLATTHDAARASAAGFAIAPCDPAGPSATRFAWPLA
jgi:putative ABC transport system ATP-binding protein